MSERIAAAGFALAILLFAPASSGDDEAGASPAAAGAAKTVEVEEESLPEGVTGTRVEVPPEILSEKIRSERIAKLQPVPKPSLLDGSESVVIEGYRERRTVIDELLAEPKPQTGPLSWAFGRMGMWAQSYRFLDTALVAYANAELLRPGDHRWPYLTGHLYSRNGDLEAAIAAFGRAHKSKPDDVPTLVWLAEQELEAGNLDAAEEHASLAIDLEPRCVKARFVEGRIAYAREDYPRAVEKLRQAMRLEMRSNTIRYALGLAYRAAGETEKAEAALSRSKVDRNRREPPLMRDPVLSRMTSHNVGARSWIRKGTEASRRGNREKAIEYFGRALAADPERPGLKTRYARALVEGGRDTEAIELLDSVEVDDANQSLVHYHLALAYQHRGDKQKAEELLRKVLKVDPKHRNARFSLARVLHETGRTKEGLAELERAIKGDPGRELPRLDRAIWLIGLGRHDDAIEFLEGDVKEFPRSPTLPMLLARLLASSPKDASRDGARSLELSQSLKKAGTPTLVVAETFAMAHAEAGDFESAVAWQKAAVEGAMRADSDEILVRAQERLANYEKRKPCRSPWVEGEEAAHGLRVRPPRT